ncbi:hypothetical protein NONI108955_37955 [Nocardia ninae]|uniref:Uncharacterized protein n=1 Tax=Nocardia ninae NBRC 108245 TaxID=1210091 RepID=A0A511MJ63_9NOCA|nr:hypothetical protein [Nocardia ninae]GEM39966.1 hypothetical protein NN4_44850 [Nocardia ninae NBRC 108245]
MQLAKLRIASDHVGRTDATADELAAEISVLTTRKWENLQVGALLVLLTLLIGAFATVGELFEPGQTPLWVNILPWIFAAFTFAAIWGIGVVLELSQRRLGSKPPTGG